MEIDRTRDPYVIDALSLAEWTNGKLRHISQNRLSKALGTSSQSIMRWKRGETKRLYQEQIDAIAQFDEKTPVEVLVMLGNSTQSTIAIPPDTIQVPIYSLGVGAGNGMNPLAGGELVMKISLDRGWLRSQIGNAAERCEGVVVVGNSMEPTLFDGDIVIVSRETVEGGGDGVYVARIDGDLTVKRVAFVGSKVHLISDNPLYPTVEVDPAVQDFAIVARVHIKCQSIV
ncbi:MAG: S24 family peptidase [Cyanobacteria bacterium J06641_5]